MTPDTEIVSNRDVYMVDIIFQNFKNKRKEKKRKEKKSVYLLKKQKDLCSLQRLIEELKIESIKTNFRVSKGACYRFHSMSLM